MMVPISLSQEPLWRADQTGLGGPRQNLVRAFRLRGPLDRAALEKSLGWVVSRHSSLRTSFLFREPPRRSAGRPPVLQIISAEARVPLSFLDLRTEPIHADRLVAEETRFAFDLTRGPLVRASLFQTGDDDHILVVSFHRMVADRRSLEIVLAEWSEGYRVCLSGEPPEPAEAPKSYADFAIWQRQTLPEAVMKRQMAYWTGRLAGVLPVLELPCDRSRAAARPYRGAEHSILLPRDLADELRRLAQREDIPLSTLLLGAFTALLVRYTGEEDVLLATPADLRERAGYQGAVGFFENTLLLRTDLSGNPSFREAVKRVRQTVAEALANRDAPFDKVMEAAQPELYRSRVQPFQVSFEWRDAPPREFRMAGLQAIPLELGGDCEAAVSLWEQGEEVRGGIRYNAALFDAETIAGVAAHYQLLLRNAVANPDQGILWLSVLPEAERQRILHEWNCTEADYPRQACIHQLIENQVERTPDRVAAVFEAERLTYAELNARANRLAHYLQGLGVGPDTRVGVSLERSLEMLVAVLGVLKAGGAYVPLDPSYPNDRLAYMVEDSRMPVLISEARLAERLSVRPPSVVCLDSDREEIAKQSAGNLPNASATSENLAYVLYTSGSTGRPKGVQIPHRAVVNFLCTMARQPGLTAEDTLVAVTTLSFDISGLELYLPLVTGARVVLASSEVASDGTRLAELMGGSGVTVMQATPATWRLLIEAGWPGDRRLKILCGGEALSRPLADELLERCGELWNMYGPTETTIWSTVWKVEPGEGPILIGHPIGNTQAYILDANLQPVPASVAGELYVGGEGLARGYLNRPELTAQAFIPDPFRDTPGARLYRTGDLVRYRRNGEIEYLGRIDHQVKIRGFRIELGEVETVLASHPEIKETVVMAREDTPDAKRLVAYFTPSPGHAPTTPELRRFLKEKLPDYMLPSAFVRLNALPRTPNGKIDRRALPPPDQERPELDKAYVAPRNAAERKLAAIWEDILGSGRSASRTTTSTWERNRW